LRLTDTGRQGFILSDFPRVLKEAEMLEEFRGGMNAFVHLSIPDQVAKKIELCKLSCNHCGKDYYDQDVVDHEH